MLHTLAGWFGLHLVLGLLSLAGIPWSLPVVLGTMGAGALAAWRLLPGPAAVAPAARQRGIGWGDALAAAALAAFTAWALTLWITLPDFVFHWGLKGRRFFLARGLDYAFLAPPWQWVVHPDYPNLLPETFAVTALAAGRFDEHAMMLWSTVCFALLLAAAREALARAGVERVLAQGALAALAATLAAYGIAGLSAGGADWLIAAALAAAVPPMLAPAGRRGAAQIGLVAAFAASAKTEGVPLAAILVTVYALRLWRAHRWTKARWSTVAALVVPTAATVVPWFLAVRRHHLFQDFNAGPLRLARLPAVLATLAADPLPEWHGLQLALLALPLLLLDRRLRALSSVVLLQLLFYLYVYLSVRIDPLPLISLSWPRLVMQLLPATLVGAVIALAGPSGVARLPPAGVHPDDAGERHHGGQQQERLGER